MLRHKPAFSLLKLLARVSGSLHKDALGTARLVDDRLHGPFAGRNVYGFSFHLIQESDTFVSSAFPSFVLLERSKLSSNRFSRCW
jgi:hypothetical protein